MHWAVPGRRGRRIVAPPLFRASERSLILNPVAVVTAPGHGLAEQLGALLERLPRSDKAQELSGLKPTRRLLAELLAQLAGSF